MIGEARERKEETCLVWIEIHGVMQFSPLAVYAGIISCTAHPFWLRWQSFLQNCSEVDVESASNDGGLPQCVNALKQSHVVHLALTFDSSSLLPKRQRLFVWMRPGTWFYFLVLMEVFARTDTLLCEIEPAFELHKTVKSPLLQDCVTRIVQNRAFGGAHCPHCRSGISHLDQHVSRLGKLN